MDYITKPWSNDELLVQVAQEMTRFGAGEVVSTNLPGLA